MLPTLLGGFHHERKQNPRITNHSSAGNKGGGGGAVLPASGWSGWYAALRNRSDVSKTVKTERRKLLWWSQWVGGAHPMLAARARLAVALRRCGPTPRALPAETRLRFT